MIGNGSPPISPFRPTPRPMKYPNFGDYGPGMSNQTWRPNLTPMMRPLSLQMPGEGTETLSPNTPVQAPPPNDDLQNKHPGLYARLAKNQIVEDLTPNLVGVSKTLDQVARQRPVKDSQLAELDDNVKRFGSFAIATLATLGLKQKILGVGEYVGFMSWFGAMAATPAVINNMVRLKTGVNLGQKYDSTYGERLNIFKDPNYLPLHILPPETMDKIAKRLNIPPGPNQRRETEEKMRQISVQTHTWWMLMAGPATPVISGLVADNLQGPVTRSYNWAARNVAGMRARKAIDNEKFEVFEARLKKAVDRLVGPLPESELTSWWKDFGEKITEETGLRDALTRKDVLDHGGAPLEEKIKQYFTNHVDKGETKHQLQKFLSSDRIDHALSYLDRQFEAKKNLNEEEIRKTEYKGKLGDLRKKTQEFLKSFETNLQEKIQTAEKANNTAQVAEMKKRLELVQRQRKETDRAILNAGNTVSHYRGLLKETQKTFDKKFTKGTISKADETALEKIRENIRSKLDNRNLSDLLYQRNNGKSQQVKEIAGKASVEIEKALKEGQHQVAYVLLGANPKNHLMKVLRDVKAHSMWRNRVVYGFGGAMLAASAIYTTFMVGRDFKSANKTQGGTGV